MSLVYVRITGVTVAICNPASDLLKMVRAVPHVATIVEQKGWMGDRTIRMFVKFYKYVKSFKA